MLPAYVVYDLSRHGWPMLVAVPLAVASGGALGLITERVFVRTLRRQGPTAQTVGTSFDALTGPNDTSAFPPDSMGAVGPTQFFVFVNGLLRTFNKTNGARDGVIETDPDAFFGSVETQGYINFTSDPQIRWCRLPRQSANQLGTVAFLH